MRIAVMATMVVALTSTPCFAAAPTEADLCAMVAKSSELKIVYTSDPADAPVRVFDLYGVGTTTANNLVVVGMQVSGYSPTDDGSTPKLPGWRTFRIDRLKSIEDAGKPYVSAVPPPAALRLVSKWSCANPVVPKG